MSSGEPFKLLAVLLLRIACYGTSLSRLAPVPLAVSGVIALSLLSAALGIGLIAFINLRLITSVDTSLRVLPEFLGLLGLLMAVTAGFAAGANHPRPPFCLSSAR